MDHREVEAYLHANIPLSRALGVRVVRLDERGAQLEAPLEPNLNHHGTAFGGSLSMVGLLAGWTLVHVGLRRAGLEARVVIQRHDVDFERPAEGALAAWAEAPAPDAWAGLLLALRRRGRGRVDVACTLASLGAPVGRCRGRYAAMTP